MIKVSYCQNSPIFGEIEKNFTQIENLCTNLSTDLLVLPELFASGYTFTSKEEAESFSESQNGRTSTFLMNLANSIDGAVIAGFPERLDNQIYNSSLLVNKNGIIGVYRKIHLFNKEKLWFSPGNLGFPVFQLPELKVGMMICFDWIFPESARTLALQGVDLIAHPANLVLPYCQNAMVTRCIENSIYAITANRIGTETRGSDSFSFTGQSQITAPKGKILQKAPNNQNQVSTIEIDPTTAREKSLNNFNNLLGDRKKEFYWDAMQ